MAPHDQHGADVRFDWGPQGLASLVAGGVRTVVIVDVLRFTSAVDVACGRGAAITPFAGEGAAAAEEAARLGAVVASPSARGGDTSSPSLSPVSLRNLTAEDHIVLCAPYGATLARQAAGAGVVVLAGCLRNATAVADAVTGFPVGMVAVGERWPDGSLRVAVEDAWGAGAIVRALSPPAPTDATLGFLALLSEAPAGAPEPTTTRSLSPEAAWAAANLPTDLPSILPKTASGRELADAGWTLDIEVAAALNVSRTVPRLDADGAFRA
jgi:2-phosphosulfolactate phosphatase